MTALKLPRTIRLDASDTFVFERAAEPGEWAVTGSFLFMDADPAKLSAKQRTAFRSGFAGVKSLGFSTLVVISEATEAELENAIQQLARHLRENFGAPGDEAALAAAREELAVSASLCGPEVNSVLAMHRSLVDGELREQFRTLQRRDPAIVGTDSLHRHARVFDFVETDDEEPEERIDLLDLAGRRA